MRVHVRAESREVEENVAFGEMKLIELAEGATAEVSVDPTRRFDMGAGAGRSISTRVAGGVVGLIIDARGRPLQLPADDAERIEALRRWNRELDVYPASDAQGGWE